MYLLAAAGAFAPVDQDYLLQARQMQALSFTVHIPRCPNHSATSTIAGNEIPKATSSGILSPALALLFRLTRAGQFRAAELDVLRLRTSQPRRCRLPALDEQATPDPSGGHLG